jgi:hypothetical protein
VNDELKTSTIFKARITHGGSKTADTVGKLEEKRPLYKIWTLMKG